MTPKPHQTQQKRVGNTAPFFARISHKDGTPYGKFTALLRVPSTPVMGTNYTGELDGNRQFPRFIPNLTVDFPALYSDCPSISLKRPVDHPVLAFADTGSTVPPYIPRLSSCHEYHYYTALYALARGITMNIELKKN